MAMGQAGMAMEGREAAAMAIFYRAYGIGLPRPITAMWTDPYGFGGAMGRSKGLPVWSGIGRSGQAGPRHRQAWPMAMVWPGHVGRCHGQGRQAPLEACPYMAWPWHGQGHRHRRARAMARPWHAGGQGRHGHSGRQAGRQAGRQTWSRAEAWPWQAGRHGPWAGRQAKAGGQAWCHG